MKPPFDPTVAQTDVKTLRHHLNQAQQHRERGNSKSAIAQEQIANAIVVRLMGELESFFRNYAASLGDYDPQQDAIAEMRIKIWKGITDISGSKEANRYEYMYWTVVRYRILTVLKEVRKQERLRLECQSLEDPFASEDGGLSESLGDRIPDQEEGLKISRLMDRMVWQRFLEEIPGPKHKVIFYARLQGDTWEDAAKKAGVTAKTAAKYNGETYEVLKRLMRAEFEDAEVMPQVSKSRKRKGILETAKMC